MARHARPERAGPSTVRPRGGDRERPIPLGDSARDAIIRAVARQAKLAPQFDLGALDRRLEPGEPGAGEGAAGLSPLDAAFAHAVYDAVMRRWLTLTYLLGREVTQGFEKIEPRMQGVLLSGAAQLLFMDRVPAHAAINHAVEWSKWMIRPGAGGLVNAVLRKVAALRDFEAPPRERYEGRRDELPLGDGRALGLTVECLPEDPLERLAVGTSHPAALLEHWAGPAGVTRARARALHSLVDPPTVLNVAHASPQVLAKVEAISVPHSEAGHRVFTGSHGELVGLLASSGDIWVQDAASSRAIAGIAELRPRRIIDLCAGQGTKTKQLACTFPESEIIATDVDADRYRTLARSFADHEGGRVRVLPMAEVRLEGAGTADLVLLDVPCSNTGVLPRRPEARYRFSADSLASVAGVQRQIIADSIPLLIDTPGRRGAILYSTCSLEPEENAAQPVWARRWHRFEAAKGSFTEPAGAPGGPATGYRDGAYSVLMRR